MTGTNVSAPSDRCTATGGELQTASNPQARARWAIAATLGLLLLTFSGTVLAKPHPARASAQFSLDWSMPERYGDANTDGLADTVYAPDGQAQIDPGGWSVNLSVSGANCGAADVRTWWIEGTKVTAGDPAVLSASATACTLSYRFPAEGVFEVAFEERDQNGTLLGLVKRAITVQDFLIVSIGDSVASGEGNPETPAPGVSWENAFSSSSAPVQCHRSRYAGPSQAALALEKADTHTSVTFIHLACSGGTILHGLLGPELRGQGPVTVQQQAQLDQLKALVGNREIDALTVSVGANDIGFSSLVQECLLLPHCDATNTPLSAAWLFARDVPRLSALYGQLAGALNAIALPPGRVYLTQYFDPTHDDNGAICNNSILNDTPLPSFFSITTAEAKWASQTMLAGLNAAGATAAGVNGWNYVGGIAPGFLDHGYCAGNHWIDRFSESQTRQLDGNGTLHPNNLGQAFYGGQIASVLHNDLYPAGSIGPRPAFRRLLLQGSTGGPFNDVLDPVAPNQTVQLRTRLNGTDTASKTISFTLVGPGSLSATSDVTDSIGLSAISYQAPASSSCNDGPVCATVTATFIDASGTHSDSITIGVPKIQVSVTPSSPTVAAGGTVHFAASVTGTPVSSVVWSTTGGSMDANGVFTAPPTLGSYLVTAISTQDATAKGTVTVQVTSASTVTITLLNSYNGAVPNASCSVDANAGIGVADETELNDITNGQDGRSVSATVPSSLGFVFSGTGTGSCTIQSAAQVSPNCLSLQSEGSGSGSASGSGPQEDAWDVTGVGTSNLVVLFSVVGGTAHYSIAAALSMSGDAKAEVDLYSVSPTWVTTPVFRGTSYDGSSFSSSGTLPPGVYEISAQSYGAGSVNNLGSGGPGAGSVGLQFNVLP